MVALLEIRWKGTEQIRVNDYKIYFSGVEDRHIYGSGYAVHKLLVPPIKELRPVSESITVLRINSKPRRYINMCLCSTDASEDNMKDTFYKNLNRRYVRLLESAIKIVLGELNAKSRKEIHFFPIIRSESIHSISNDNGLRVI